MSYHGSVMDYKYLLVSPKGCWASVEGTQLWCSDQEETPSMPWDIVLTLSSEVRSCRNAKASRSHQQSVLSYIPAFSHCLCMREITTYPMPPVRLARNSQHTHSQFTQGEAWLCLESEASANMLSDLFILSLSLLSLPLSSSFSFLLFFFLTSQSLAM